MADGFAVVLRACPEEVQADVAGALGRVFGIKEATCQSLIGSAPIILVDALTEDAAAVLQLLMHGLTRHGAQLAFTRDGLDELPRINWPKPPLVFKQRLDELAGDFAIDLPGGPLVDQLRQKLHGAPARRTPHGEAPASESAGRQVFNEVELGEITPFSNQAIPSTPPQGNASGSGTAPTLRAGSEDELLDRMNELFPDEGDGIIPNTDDITNMLDRLLPDEDGGSSAARPAATTNGSGPSGGFSVFLAKISDENRRKKAVPLLAEMSGISEDEADKLAKKVIIPVLKGVSKSDAEEAKHRFAAIGVLARIKGG